ncbi:MAG: GNAT family N-acetyltransferase [Gammaproteobacteria bacterium]|nr:GNAT family N-acetyltransferase [Gammaproteobacteria bacterium]
MAGEPSIRAPARDDLPALVAIYNEAIAQRSATGHLVPFAAAEREAWFAGHLLPETPLFVAERDGAVAGYATLAHYRGGRGAFAGCREVSYFVAECHRRQGVASALLGHAVAACPALGVDVLLAFLLGHNRPSVAFLERHGFACWGRLPGVARIDGERRDHLVYGRQLG